MNPLSTIHHIIHHIIHHLADLALVILSEIIFQAGGSLHPHSAPNTLLGSSVPKTNPLQNPPLAEPITDPWDERYIYLHFHG